MERSIWTDGHMGSFHQPQIFFAAAQENKDFGALCRGPSMPKEYKLRFGHIVGGGGDFVLWIDYLIHIQNSIGDTRIGLVFSEDEKTPPYGDRQNRVI